MPRIPVLKSLKFICIRQPSAARRTYKSSIKNTALIFLHAVAAFNRNGPPFALGLSPPSPSHILPVFCLLLYSTLSFLSHSSWVFVYILVILKIVSSLPITFFFSGADIQLCSSHYCLLWKLFSNHLLKPERKQRKAILQLHCSTQLSRFRYNQYFSLDPATQNEKM